MPIDAGLTFLHCICLLDESPFRLQVALLSVELCSAREEAGSLRALAEAREPGERLLSAIRARDDAAAK